MARWARRAWSGRCHLLLMCARLPSRLTAWPRPLPRTPGASAAVICAHHGLGGAGAVDLANAVVAATAGPKPAFKFLYDVNLSIKVRARARARAGGQVVGDSGVGACAVQERNGGGVG